MDWNAAIEHNREALKRVLAALVAMAGLGGLPISPSTGAGPAASGSSRPLDAFRHATGMTYFGQSPKPASLPRHLRLAILRLLRPAEAAARRLVIAAARGIEVEPAPARRRKPAPAPLFLPRRSGGTGIVLPAGFAPPPPCGASRRGAETPPSALGFRLLDPLARHRPRRPTPRGVPRISLPGVTRPFAVTRRPPAPDDPVDATRLALRLEALERALDDLPAQARRFARWQARATASARDEKAGVCEAKPDGRPRGKIVRRWPLRMGRLAGGRRKDGHDIHNVLIDTHGLALWALERRDTS